MPVPSRYRSTRYVLAGLAAAVLVAALVAVYAMGRDAEHIQGEVAAGEYLVTAVVDGHVEDLRVNEGDYVRAGDTLVVIDVAQAQTRQPQPPPTQAAAAAANQATSSAERQEQLRGALQVLQQAKAGLAIAEQSYRRMQQLFDEGAMSAQNRDEAFANFKAMEAQLQAAQSQYDRLADGAGRETALRETVLTAQEDGEVSRVCVQVGACVEAGAPLLGIQLMTDMWGVFHVPEHQLNGLQVGDELNAFAPAFKKSLRMKIFSLEEEDAPAGQEASKAHGRQGMKTFTVKARPIEKPDGLRPGMALVIL
jgi:HlyD family secretion protein